MNKRGFWRASVSDRKEVTDVLPSQRAGAQIDKGDSSSVQVRRMQQLKAKNNPKKIVSIIGGALIVKRKKKLARNWRRVHITNA